MTKAKLNEKYGPQIQILKNKECSSKDFNELFKMNSREINKMIYSLTYNYLIYETDDNKYKITGEIKC